MRDNFEGAVACLLPVCPYQKYKHSNGKERQPRNISEFSAKAGKGDTGVEYRWYKKPEYEKLIKKQRMELYTWQNTREGKEARKKNSPSGNPHDKKGDTRDKKAMKKTIKSLMPASNKVQQQQMDQDMLQIASALAVPKVPVPPGRANAPPPAAAAPIISVVEGIVQRIADRNRKISDTEDEECLSPAVSSLQIVERNLRMKLQPELNDYVQAKVSVFASISSTVSSDSPMPRTELDRHANMIVVGKNAFVFSRVIGRTCEVTPFSSELGTVKEVPIVDAAIAYHCQFTNETFVLIVRNALYIHNMDHNLVPPFILREAGVLINDVPRIHVQEPTENDHAIVFPDEILRIPLQLHGIFSYFHTRMPTTQEIYECAKIIITPDSTDWDPHNESYALNEESMLDWHGNMMESRYRKRYIIERPLQDADIAVVSIASFESHVDENLAKAFSSMELNPASGCESGAQTEASIFATSLNRRLETAKVVMSLGSMDKGEASNLFDTGLFESAEPRFFHMDYVKSELDGISVNAVDGAKP